MRNETIKTDFKHEDFVGKVIDIDILISFVFVSIDDGYRRDDRFIIGIPEQKLYGVIVVEENNHDDTEDREDFR